MAHAFYDIIDFNDDQHLEMDDFAHIFQVLDADRELLHDGDFKNKRVVLDYKWLSRS